MDSDHPDASGISFSAFDESFSENVTSTPCRTANRSSINQGKSHNISFFKSPLRTVKNRKREPKASCKECGKSYTSLKHFNNHVRLHSIEKIASHVPSEEDILNNIEGIDKEVMKRCSMSLIYGPNTEEYKDLIKTVQNGCEANLTWAGFRDIIVKHLCTSITSSKFLLPSQLLTVLVQASQDLLTSVESRRDLADIVKLVHPTCDINVIQNFICDYVFECLLVILSFISTSMRKNNSATGVKNVCIEKEEEEVIFYCGGSVLRGFLNMGRRYCNNAAWQRIVCCIKRKLLESEETLRAPDYQRRWTEDINRGGLTIINAKTTEFFIAVTKTCALSEEDGTMSYDKIVQKVLSDGTANIWDEIVGDALSLRESLSLMYGVTKSFCQTCGNGIARRLRNHYTGSKATASVTLRHHVAPK